MSSKDIVPKDEKSQLPSFMADQVSDVAGLGNSTSAQDNTLPFLSILQPMSPQLNKQKPDKFIKGAEVGMLFNTATNQIFSGEEGIILIPCGFQKNWVEWTPREDGGGYVATHPFDIDLPKRMKCVKDDRGRLVTPEKTHLVETAYTLVLTEAGMPLVLAASSTALKPMRDWMSLRNTFYINRVRAPSFSRRYLAKTVYQQNDKGGWYNWKIEDLGWLPDQDIFAVAKDFALQVSKGEVQVGRPPDDYDAATPSSEGVDDKDIPI